MKALDRLWWMMLTGVAALLLIGRAIGPFRRGYAIKNFYYVFFALSVLIVFLIIPETRKRIFRKARGFELPAYRRASLITWALAECIALFGLTAYLIAADRATFYGLALAACIILVNFKPGLKPG